MNPFVQKIMQEFIDSNGKGFDTEPIPIKKTMTHTELSKLIQSTNQEEDQDPTYDSNYMQTSSTLQSQMTASSTPQQLSNGQQGTVPLQANVPNYPSQNMQQMQ